MYYSILWLVLITSSTWLTAGATEQRRRVITTIRTEEGNQTTYTISFGGRGQITCNICPNHHTREPHDAKALQDAIEGFKVVEQEFSQKTTLEKIQELRLLISRHHEAISTYQQLIEAYLNFYEAKDSGPLLQDIDNSLYELDQWVNPYFARMCLERAKHLTEPTYKTPFLTFLATQHKKA